MDLKRVCFEIRGNDLDLAKLAAEALPEGVMGGHDIYLRVISAEDKKFELNTPAHSKLYSVDLPAGLSNINIYRNDEKDGSGKVSFSCGGYHYVIPPLRDQD